MGDMSTVTIILGGLQILLCMVLIAIILLQSAKSPGGMSGAIAGGAETFFGKNKSRQFDAKLHRFTAFAAGLYIIVTIALNFVQ